MPGDKPSASKGKTRAPKGGAAAKPRAKPRAAAAAADGGASLVIVESPAKMKTISRFLSGRYLVRSSFGHVRDLPENKLGVDVGKDFVPTYVLLPRTEKILPELKRLAEAAPAVYLATDHDREGESIAWHLVDILGLPEEKVRRITFHEITRDAIQEALRSPRGIDQNLVQAQQARRVLDRLVGYKLSPLLWKKVRRGLSAGRVQSVAVRLLVERHKEIQEFKSEPYWTLTAILELPGTPPPFEARLSSWKGEKVESTRTYELFAEPYRVRTTSFKTQDEIEAVVRAVSAARFTVRSVERKEVRRGPSPPFTTSTLQQAASQRFGLPAERTMRIAQSLYEGVDIGLEEPAGLITYMRTDSVSVARQAQDAARRLVAARYGEAYLPPEPPVYRTKTLGAQEAHEAIRPTDPGRLPEDLRPHLDSDQARLYELIWKRFTASQMADAVYDTVGADIAAGEALFRATGRTLKFDGYLRVFQAAEAAPAAAKEEAEAVEGAEPEAEAAEPEDGRLPPLAEGAALGARELKPEDHRTSPPPSYNEASLIRALEKHGIGRPSTYAPTIKTIVDRGYVRRGVKDRTLSASDLGILVTERLKEHFPDVVNLSYTADVEERLDRIAEGTESWHGVVRSFYGPFEKALKTAADAMEKVQPQVSEEDCPLCHAKMLIRESRYGKYLSCSRFPQCKGKIRLTQEGEKMVPQATEEKCELCGKPMVIRMGRRGRFLACSGYPACRNTYSLDDQGNKIASSRPVVTAIKCEKCGSALWLRKGKRGHFLACSGFPKCRNLKPVSADEAERIKKESGAPQPTKEGGSLQEP